MGQLARRFFFFVVLVEPDRVIADLDPSSSSSQAAPATSDADSRAPLLWHKTIAGYRPPPRSQSPGIVPPESLGPIGYSAKMVGCSRVSSPDKK